MTTIDAIRARVRTRLEEATPAVWTNDELDEQITGALETYSRLYPLEAIETLPIADAVTSVSLPADTIAVIRVTLATGDVVPRRAAPLRRVSGEELAWEVFGGTLFFSLPPGAQNLTVWRTTAMTLAGLPASDEGLLVLLAVADALEARAIQNYKRGVPAGEAVGEQVIARLQRATQLEIRRRTRRLRSSVVG